MNQREADFQPNKKNYKPPPEFSEPAEIKLNVAAILKEEKKLV